LAVGGGKCEFSSMGEGKLNCATEEIRKTQEQILRMLQGVIKPPSEPPKEKRDRVEKTRSPPEARKNRMQERAGARRSLTPRGEYKKKGLERDPNLQTEKGKPGNSPPSYKKNPQACQQRAKKVKVGGRKLSMGCSVVSGLSRVTRRFRQSVSKGSSTPERREIHYKKRVGREKSGGERRKTPTL